MPGAGRVSRDKPGEGAIYGSIYDAFDSLRICSTSKERDVEKGHAL
jgi:hypothetical protein